MARGKKIEEGKTLVVYSTKVLQSTRDQMDALARISNLGQRELLEEMIKQYRLANPDKAERADAMIALLGYDEQAAATETVAQPREVSQVDFVSMEQHVAAELGVKLSDEREAPAAAPRTVTTVKYLGQTPVHLYEPGRKNGTGCGLSGVLDTETITEASPEAVDCKKCRYCRKAVFQ